MKGAGGVPDAALLGGFSRRTISDEKRTISPFRRIHNGRGLWIQFATLCRLRASVHCPLQLRAMASRVESSLFEAPQRDPLRRASHVCSARTPKGDHVVRKSTGGSESVRAPMLVPMAFDTFTIAGA